MSSITCFFCENLISDYLEGLLPSARHREIDSHLGTCSPCRDTKEKVEKTISSLHALEMEPVDPSVVLQVTQAITASKTSSYRLRSSRWAIGTAAALLVFAGLSVIFPRAFPWFTRLRLAEDDSAFSRYFPMLQGAGDIIEEQSSWLYVKDPLMGSLWEEGGLSPEEFEKTFQKKGVKEFGP